MCTLACNVCTTAMDMGPASRVWCVSVMMALAQMTSVSHSLPSQTSSLRTLKPMVTSNSFRQIMSQYSAVPRRELYSFLQPYKCRTVFWNFVLIKAQYFQGKTIILTNHINTGQIHKRECVFLHCYLVVKNRKRMKKTDNTNNISQFLNCDGLYVLTLNFLLYICEALVKYKILSFKIWCQCIREIALSKQGCQTVRLGNTYTDFVSLSQISVCWYYHFLMSLDWEWNRFIGFSGGQPSDKCGTLLSGRSMYFSNTGTRLLTTRHLNLTYARSLHYHHKMISPFHCVHCHWKITDHKLCLSWLNIVTACCSNVKPGNLAPDSVRASRVCENNIR